MKYKSVVVTRRGGPEVIDIIAKDLLPPAAGEARIRVLASPVVQDDIAVRNGNRPFAARPPFVPGYAIIGVVDAVGQDVSQVEVGQRVAALTNFGGHAEYIYYPADRLAPVPAALDAAAAVVLLLNYLVAHQIMHRVVQVKPHDKALIIGASGGVGTAFLDLGKLAGLKMYGLASAAKHPVLQDYGATPLDYRTQDFVQVLREAEPAGLDYVFNGMGEAYFEPGLAVLRRGGVLVHYGGPQSTARLLVLVLKLVGYNLLPNGKTIKGYGTHREPFQTFEADWATLFHLLGENRIKPIIAARFPILEAPRAYDLLESGQVTGNVVLLAPDLLGPANDHEGATDQRP
jgi:NADPH:quinone reductase-like Zn-dependent oxidoreductase